MDVGRNLRFLLHQFVDSARASFCAYPVDLILYNVDTLRCDWSKPSVGRVVAIRTAAVVSRAELKCVVPVLWYSGEESDR